MSSEKTTASKPALNSFPLRAPRFWHGMRAGQWWSMLARNGFRVSPSRLHLAAGVSFFTPFNDVLGLLQHTLYGRAIRETKIEKDPLFVLGHWRSGTTLMHELIGMDEQFASPSTYACFAPWHFLISEKLMFKYGSALLPEKRPMDNMRAGWELPQEDEFALMNLGAPTPYLRIAFPRAPEPWMNFIDMQDVGQADLDHWSECFTWFIRALTLHHNKQLILKSPPHTGRVKQLLKLFPNARFIHMVRDPRKLFASTKKLWRSLDEVQGMQRDTDDVRLEEYIWTCLSRMYAAFEADRALIPEGRLIDVHYEDLVAAPVATLQQVYQQLEMDGFEQVRPAIESRFAKESNYQVNEHRIDTAMEQQVLDRWGDYARRYGYA